jgi:ubiquinone/menaquinone biosynthesis C-methylase UbiE
VPSRADPPPGVNPTFWSLVVAEELRGRTVVDVGTGNGRVALALAPRCRRVVGIDRDAALVAEARRRAAAAGLASVTFVEGDADGLETFRDLAAGIATVDVVTAHMFLSDPLVVTAARSLAAGGVLVCAGFHTDHWRETGRPSRFAYDEPRMRTLLEAGGFAIEHLAVDRDVRRFASVEEALAGAVGLQERWQTDGRWFRYIEFLERGGRTLTHAYLVAKGRRR